METWDEFIAVLSAAVLACSKEERRNTPVLGSLVMLTSSGETLVLTIAAQPLRERLSFGDAREAATVLGGALADAVRQCVPDRLYELLVARGPEGAG